MANVYWRNTGVTLTATFRLGRSLADPGQVRITITPPTGAPVTKAYPADPAIVRGSEGNYRYELTPGVVGRWKYAWQGTSPVPVGHESVFYVEG